MKVNFRMIFVLLLFTNEIFLYHLSHVENQSFTHTRILLQQFIKVFLS